MPAFPIWWDYPFKAAHIDYIPFVLSCGLFTRRPYVSAILNPGYDVVTMW
jgi:hypothetical protein